MTTLSGSILRQYSNGNAEVILYKDGTRIISYPDEGMRLDFPLNIDITITEACSNGYNPRISRAVCPYCHVSARTDGKEGDLKLLKNKLEPLADKGIELAIGGNDVASSKLHDFLLWARYKGFICNLTVNQLHIRSVENILKSFIENDLIKGLGISYRDRNISRLDPFFFHENSVLHVIAGLDDVDEVLTSPFNKVLVLGYKNFGYGVDYLSSYQEEIGRNIRQWQIFLPKFFGKKIISFDNLAIEQLKIARFFTDENWDVFYQGEESIYIDTVGGFYAPSSRSSERTDWNSVGIEEYFKVLKNGATTG